MAGLEVEGDSVVVRLSALERLGALAGSPRRPLGAVEAVRVSETPWKELRGLRAPGTGWPGKIMLGTLRYSGGRDFAAVYGRTGKAVVVDFAPGGYRRFVVSLEHAEDVAATIAAVAGKSHDPTRR